MKFESESALLEFASTFASYLKPGLAIGLKGDLGAGKTTFSRGILQGLGHEGHVKSPTYTIVEPYAFSEFTVYHIDLYRLNDLEELHEMGFEEYLSGDSVALLEWPERMGCENLDVLIQIDVLDQGRELTLHAKTKTGEALLEALQ